MKPQKESGANAIHAPAPQILLTDEWQATHATPPACTPVEGTGSIIQPSQVPLLVNSGIQPDPSPHDNASTPQTTTPVRAPLLRLRPTAITPNPLSTTNRVPTTPAPTRPTPHFPRRLSLALPTYPPQPATTWPPLPPDPSPADQLADPPPPSPIGDQPQCVPASLLFGRQPPDMRAPSQPVSPFTSHSPPPLSTNPSGDNDQCLFHDMLRVERPFTRESGSTVWYESYSEPPCTRPPQNLAVNTGEFYLDRDSEGNARNLWMKVRLDWEIAKEGSLHPTFGRRLHIRASGEPSWLTSRSYATQKSRSTRRGLGLNVNTPLVVRLQL